MQAKKRNKLRHETNKTVLRLIGWLVFCLLLHQSALAQPVSEKVSSDSDAIFQKALNNFISQGPTKFNPNAPLRNDDCGPTSMAMALKLLGKLIARL
jgi:hypothetical protein